MSSAAASFAGRLPHSYSATAGPRRRGRADRRAADALTQRRPEALALVMDAHGGVLLGYLTQAVGDRPTAEDVLQQVLLDVWQRGASYDPARSGLLTWLLMIARHRAIDELRRRVPVPTDVAPPERGALPDESERLLERWRMAGLLERLPRDEASLLRLRFYDALTQTEIAEHTGVPLGTVKTRMVNGLAHLRALIEAEEREQPA